MQAFTSPPRQSVWSLLLAVPVFALVALTALVNPASAAAASGPFTHTNYGFVPIGAVDYPFWTEQVTSSDRVMYVPDPAGQRGIVQRVEVKPGDTNVLGSGANGERAEVINPSELGGFVDGQTIVLSWGLFIDSGFASPSGDWNTFAQIHAGGGNNQPPLHLNLVGDQAELKLGLFGGGDWIPSGQPTGSSEESFSFGSLSKNQWHDFLVELRFGCNGAGYAKLWVDGMKILDAQDRKIGYCGDPGLYWKQGFYRAAYDQATRVWFSDTFRWVRTSDALGHYGWKNA